MMNSVLKLLHSRSAKSSSACLLKSFQTMAVSRSRKHTSTTTLHNSLTSRDVYEIYSVRVCAPAPSGTRTFVLWNPPLLDTSGDNTRRK